MAHEIVKQLLSHYYKSMNTKGTPVYFTTKQRQSYHIVKLMGGYVATDGLYAKYNKRVLLRISLIQSITNSGTRGLRGYLTFSKQPYYHYY